MSYYFNSRFVCNIIFALYRIYANLEEIMALEGLVVRQDISSRELVEKMWAKTSDKPRFLERVFLFLTQLGTYLVSRVQRRAFDAALYHATCRTSLTFSEANLMRRIQSIVGGELFGGSGEENRIIEVRYGGERAMIIQSGHFERLEVIALDHIWQGGGEMEIIGKAILLDGQVATSTFSISPQRVSEIVRTVSSLNNEQKLRAGFHQITLPAAFASADKLPRTPNDPNRRVPVAERVEINITDLVALVHGQMDINTAADKTPAAGIGRVSLVKRHLKAAIDCGTPEKAEKVNRALALQGNKNWSVELDGARLNLVRRLDLN